MIERRYDEAEVDAIFERATEAQQTPRRLGSHGEGLTLAELQEIGHEVGIPPELVAGAAMAVDQRGLPASRTFLGLPIGVGRTVDLERPLSEQEWDRLVVDLRETFDARGTVKHEGSFRQWTNGNLQALLEPTATGQRLRLRTVKGEARSMMAMGIAGVGFATVMGVIIGMGGGISDGWPLVGFLATTGLAMFGLAAVRLPGWAKLRRRQMEGVAARLALASGSQSSADPPAGKHPSGPGR